MTPLHLKIPATSANLGPGFDALGLAMAVYLTVDAELAEDFRIDATGRNADLCSDVEKSLIVTTYRDILAASGKAFQPIWLRLHNEIPLGMGMGSSAAALVAGVVLANHFGQLGWSNQRMLEEACRREGHPDNVAACWLGGMTVSADGDHRIVAATYGKTINWRLMVALPSVSLSTEKARGMLPATYSRADAVANLQSVALLSSAFALNQKDLLQVGMRDRIHQPYRMEACPLLAKLLPLAGQNGILGVALSGAGPSVLLIAEEDSDDADLIARIRNVAGDPALEVLPTRIAEGVTIGDI